METAIIIVWSVALVVALLLTLWILKLVFLIVKTERDIIKLATTTLEAAHGIQRHTALITGLEATTGVAGKILGAATAIEAGAASIKRKLQGVEKALKERSL